MQLKNEINQIAPIVSNSTSKCDETWTKFMNQIRYLILNDDVSNFLEWPVILKTMFAAHAKFIFLSYYYLRRSSNWHTLFKNAVIESSLGNPMPFLLYPYASSNLIHLSYLLSLFVDQTGEQPEKLDVVFEFGGGYGSMCRLLHRANFQGTYIIFDLPVLSALQRFYLKSVGLPVSPAAEVESGNPGIICISDLNQLKRLLQQLAGPAANSLFIATWSISETSLELRNQIMDLVNPFKSFLITYQEQFWEIDNFAYFSHWVESHHLMKKLYHSKAKHAANNYDLMGTTN
jgi:hypothetical protein